MLITRKTHYYRFGYLLASKYQAKGRNLEMGVHLLLNTYQAKDSSRFGGPIASKYLAEDRNGILEFTLHKPGFH